ncbi:MAG: hypothetical protein ABFE13_04700 [Phycisphaerales bacterium]
MARTFSQRIADLEAAVARVEEAQASIAETAPVILTWDPTWGAEPVVTCGSEAATAGEKEPDNLFVQEAQKVRYVGLDLAQMGLWMADKGHVNSSQPQDYYGGAIVWTARGWMIGSPFRANVSALDRENGSLTFSRQWDEELSHKIIRDCRYSLEDKPQDLDSPGEFSFNESSRHGLPSTDGTSLALAPTCGQMGCASHANHSSAREFHALLLILSNQSILMSRSTRTLGDMVLSLAEELKFVEAAIPRVLEVRPLTVLDGHQRVNPNLAELHCWRADLKLPMGVATNGYVRGLEAID